MEVSGANHPEAESFLALERHTKLQNCSRFFYKVFIIIIRGMLGFINPRVLNHVTDGANGRNKNG